jgi:arsenite methyltransferase
MQGDGSIPPKVASEKRDIWAEWLAVHRYGGDPDVRARMLEETREFREGVLDGAALAEGETLLDVGCGEGLIGFGALERGAGHVVFSDISDDLLDFCREAAEAAGVVEQCSFVKSKATDLGPVPDESVDVVTTRSVLIYVRDKAAAFDEFFRVLRPGGRVSLFEPINRFGMEHWKDGFWGYPSDGLAELGRKVDSVYEEIQPPDDPMLDFDERDLVRLAEDTGFFPVGLELRVYVRSSEPQPWEAFLKSSGNPKIPTIEEAMDRALTAEERDLFAEHLRPLVEEGKGVLRRAHAYLTAVKPG